MKKIESGLTPNPWDKVKMRKGKLIGKLTDELSLSSMPKTGGDGIPTKLTGKKSVNEPRVNKQLPNKFK